MNEEAVRGLLDQQQAAAEIRFQTQMAALAQQQQDHQTQMATQLMQMQTRAAVAERDAATLREAMQHVASSRPAGRELSDEQQELKSVIDIKILERLEVFNGEDSRWESWLAGFEALTGLIGMDEMMRTGASSAVTMQECQLDALGGDEVRRKAKALWYMLMQACRNKSRNIVKTAEKFNGVQAWKLLMQEYRPQMAGRFNAMLMSLLKPRWDETTPFLDALAQFEVDCTEYTSQSNEPFGDRTKIAVVTQHCPRATAWVVRTAALQCGDNYKTFKAQIELYLKQSMDFDSYGVGAVPMDVGGIWGKGGKPPGKHPRAGQVCPVCNKVGHTKDNCWYKKGAPPKGGKKGDGGQHRQPPGKGSSSQTSSHSSKPFDGECNYCHKPGHKAADCRKKAFDAKKVGGVGGDNASVAESQATASTMPSSASALNKKGVGGIMDPVV